MMTKASLPGLRFSDYTLSCLGQTVRILSSNRDCGMAGGGEWGREGTEATDLPENRDYEVWKREHYWGDWKRE